MRPHSSLVRRPRRSTAFEAMLDRSHLPVSMTQRFYDPDFNHNLPSAHLLSLLSVPDLLNLRLACRATAAWVEQACPAIFSTLYVIPALESHRKDHNLLGLRRVGMHCQELVIRLSYTESGPSQSSHPDDSQSASRPRAQTSPRTILRWPSRLQHPRSLSHPAPYAPCPRESALEPPPPTLPTYWLPLLSLTPHVATLTVSAPGSASSARPTLSTLEASLIALRQALERSRPRCLATLRLFPLSPHAILHLRWSGGTAFRAADWTGSGAWAALRQLHVHCTNAASAADPAARPSPAQQRDAAAVLHDWLASFRARLEVLRWTWLGRPGPCVLFLDEGRSGRPQRRRRVRFSAPPIVWKALREVRLEGAAVALGQITRLFGERARMLRLCTVVGGVVVGPGEEEQWDVLRSLGVVWEESAGGEHVVHEFWREVGRESGVLAGRLGVRADEVGSEESEMRDLWDGLEDEGPFEFESDDDEAETDGEMEGEIPVLFVG